MRKIIVIALGIIILAATALLINFVKSRPHYTSERREWKNVAIEAIKSDLNKSNNSISANEDWKTATRIVCEDSSWLAYRAQCYKVDPKVHDIFIAKASNGKWYYSDFHFCVDMIVLEDQPHSLDDFIYQYFLVEFDGSSDKALDPSWIPVGEMRFPNDSE